MRNLYFFVIMLIAGMLALIYGAQAAEFRQGGIALGTEVVSSSGGTKVMGVTSGQVIEITGTQSHTVQLPDATVVKKGWIAKVVNSSTSADGVNVRDDGGNLLVVLKENDQGEFILLYDATATGRWSIQRTSATGISGGGASNIAAAPPVTYNPISGEIGMPAASSGVDGYMPGTSMTQIDDHETRITDEEAFTATQTTINANNTVELADHEDRITDLETNPNLPDQTGNAGKFLSTDGTDPSWETVDALPDQTGQNGKFLATDGTDATWQDVPGVTGSDLSVGAGLSITSGTGVGATLENLTIGIGSGFYLPSTSDQTNWNSKAPATSGSSILKGNGSGGFSSATSGTDYAPATSGTGYQKGNGSGGFTNQDAPIPLADGGTGQTTKTAAFDALSPTSTKGQTIVNDGTNNVALDPCEDDELRVADSSQANGFRCQTANLSLRTDPVTYTPVFTGFGTVSGVEIEWARDGNSIVISGRFVSGTTTATQARISLPSGLTIASSITANRLVGDAVRSNTGGTNNFTVLANGGQTYVTFAKKNSTTNPLSGEDANQLFAGSDVVSFTTDPIEIAEWAQATTVNLFKSGDYGWTPTSITPAAGFGAVTNGKYWIKKTGDTATIRGYFKTGTVANTTASLGLPSGIVIDDTKLSTAQTNVHGRAQVIRSSASAVSTADNNYAIIYDGSTTDRVFISFSSASDVLIKSNADNFTSNGDGIHFEFSIPVKDWSTFPIGVAGITHVASLSAPSAGNCAVSSNNWISGTPTSAGTGRCAVIFKTGIFTKAPICIVTNRASGAYVARLYAAETTSGAEFYSFDSAAQSASNQPMNIQCTQPN